ncbi:MAG: class I SAM-dependent methyltransferase [Methanomicrobia archaeon]|nr:class I SAM-dependent methyltransferase [Methanomicrobia archaeon]
MTIVKAEPESLPIFAQHSLTPELHPPRFRHVRCAICGADRYERVGRPRVEVRFRSALMTRTVSIVKCKRCGFFYAQPMPLWDLEALQKIYGQDYFPEMSTWWQAEKTTRNPRRRLDRLEYHARCPIRTFLEVGCGLGHGMRAALQRGWAVYGQEVSSTFADAVKSALGIEVFLGFLEEAKYPDQYFDAIYLDSVLEHLPNPLDMLRELRRILSPQGVLFITVTNQAALVSRVSGTVSKALCLGTSPVLSPFAYPYHLVGFSGQTLRIACDRVGFEVKELVIRAGTQEWRKLALPELTGKALITTMLSQPLYLLGERLGQGIALEAVLGHAEHPG